jgi:hypothetical protein
MNNTINIKELRQRLPELQIAWLQMDRGHQEWGNCAKSYRESMNGKKFVTLEMRNENFGINIYLNNVGVEVRSVTEKSDSIAVQLWFEDAPLDPDDLYNLLMTEAKKQCRGSKILQRHRSVLDRCWKELMRVATKVPEPEEIPAIYNYDE